MLIDCFGRKITYLRISVTDRCNLRCKYCMPVEGVEWKPHSKILRYEQIADIVRAAADLGIDKIRLTGGEPLIKKNIEYLVKLIARIDNVRDISMTTNGTLLTQEKASALKNAGLNRVNISLDTLNPAVYSELTRGGELNDIIRGIDNALEFGLTPVKINMVISEETTEQDIETMGRFCSDKGVQLQTIRQFSLYDKSTSYHAVITDRPEPCSQCNRIRLTADGHLKPCLFSDDEIPIDHSDYTGSILKAVESKPENGKSCQKRGMNQIGG